MDNTFLFLLFLKSKILEVLLSIYSKSNGLKYRNSTDEKQKLKPGYKFVKGGDIEKSGKSTKSKESLRNQKNNYAMFNSLSGEASISSKEFEKMTVSELRDFTFNYYKKELKGKKIAIKNSLKSVEFTTKAGRKISKGGAMYKEKAALIDNLEKIIKNSSYNNWGNRKSNDAADILGYLNFKSKVLIDGTKRHVRISIALFQNRKTLLKNYDIGKKKSKSLSKGSDRLPSVEENDLLFNVKNTKADLKIQEQPKKITVTVGENPTNLTADQPIETFKGEVLTDPPLKNSLNLKPISHSSTKNHNYFNINGSLATFLGKVEIKPKHSVAWTLDAEQGAGKTRAFFRAINEFAKNYKVLFVSAEEHPESALFIEKRDLYIEPSNQQNVFAIDETNFDKIKDLIPHFDVVFFDSWNKIAEKNKTVDFDNNLRKGYDGKFFGCIFQRTVTGTMRGGSKAQFDGDIISKMIKGANYKESYVKSDKNRYQHKPLNEVCWNIYYNEIFNEEALNGAEPAEPQINLEELAGSHTIEV